MTLRMHVRKIAGIDPRDCCCLRNKLLRSNFMKDKLSPSLCGFRKQHSAQHALICVIEKWKKCMDDSGTITIVAVLMDLSKTYNCIPHDLF